MKFGQTCEERYAGEQIISPCFTKNQEQSFSAIFSHLYLFKSNLPSSIDFQRNVSW